MAPPKSKKWCRFASQAISPQYAQIHHRFGFDAVATRPSLTMALGAGSGHASQCAAFSVFATGGFAPSRTDS